MDRKEKSYMAGWLCNIHFMSIMIYIFHNYFKDSESLKENLIRWPIQWKKQLKMENTARAVRKTGDYIHRKICFSDSHGVMFQAWYELMQFIFRKCSILQLRYQLKSNSLFNFNWNRIELPCHILREIQFPDPLSPLMFLIEFLFYTFAFYFFFYWIWIFFLLFFIFLIV